MALGLERNDHKPEHRSFTRRHSAPPPPSASAVFLLPCPRQSGPLLDGEMRSLLVRRPRVAVKVSSLATEQSGRGVRRRAASLSGTHPRALTLIVDNPNRTSTPAGRGSKRRANTGNGKTSGRKSGKTSAKKPRCFPPPEAPPDPLVGLPPDSDPKIRKRLSTRSDYFVSLEEYSLEEEREGLQVTLRCGWVGLGGDGEGWEGGGVFLRMSPDLFLSVPRVRKGLIRHINIRFGTYTSDSAHMQPIGPIRTPSVVSRVSL